MAYCKECGAHVHEGDHHCRACGKAVSHPDVIDRSEVEIVHGGATQRRRVLRAPKKAVDPQVSEHTFVLFDRKIAILLGLVILMQLLAFLFSSVEHSKVDLWAVVRGVPFFAAGVLIVFAILLKSRTALRVALWAMGIAAVVSVVITLIQTDLSTVAKSLRWACLLLIPVLLGGWIALVLYEMAKGKRQASVHTVIICLVSIFLLMYLIVSMLGDVTGGISELALACQICEMIAKVFMLCMVLVIYSNMGRLSVTDKY